MEDHDVTDSGSADFMIAEYQGLLESFWRTEELGEKRVEFFVGLATALLGAVFLLEGVTITQQICAMLALSTLGLIVTQRIIRRNLKSHEYLRAMGRIRRFFDDAEEGTLRKFMFHAPCDSRPTRSHRLRKLSEKHGRLWVLHWGTGGLLETISLFSSLLWAGTLYLLSSHVSGLLYPSASQWVEALHLGIALMGGLISWILLRVVSARAYQSREHLISEMEDCFKESQEDVRFPCGTRD